MLVKKYLLKRNISYENLNEIFHTLNIPFLRESDYLTDEEIIAINTYLETGKIGLLFPHIESLPIAGTYGLYIDIISGNNIYNFYQIKWKEYQNHKNDSNFKLIELAFSILLGKKNMSELYGINTIKISHKSITDIRIIKNGHEILNTRQKEFLPYKNKLIISENEVLFQNRKEVRKLVDSKEEFENLYYDLRIINILKRINYEDDLPVKHRDIINILKLNDQHLSVKKLSDYQCAILCKGMLESEARKLGEQYFSSLNDDSFEREKANLFISKAIEKYGEDFVFKCLELPEKPFHTKTVERIFSEFDTIMKNSVGIELIFKNDQRFNFYFRSEKLLELSINSKLVSTLSDSGVFSQISSRPESNASATLLLSYAKDPSGEYLFFGAETGKCVFCNKELDHPISKLYGYGKVCAQNRNLTWG